MIFFIIIYIFSTFVLIVEKKNIDRFLVFTVLLSPCKGSIGNSTFYRNDVGSKSGLFYKENVLILWPMSNLFHKPIQIFTVSTVI